MPEPDVPFDESNPDEFLTTSTLVAQLLDDQRKRWQRGERIWAETYREQYPSLGIESSWMLYLIQNEIRLRELNGDIPQIDEYENRFPELKDSLQQLLRADTIVDNPSINPELSTESVNQRPIYTDAMLPRVNWPEVPGYRILGMLGKGGMGVVYRAKDIGLNRMVALKMLRKESEATLAEIRRFMTEVRAMAQLDHPHIVPVYEVGECQGQPYFTAKLLEGGSLTHHIERLQGDRRQAVEMMAKVARAVQYLHDRNIIHRDLKPSNILLDDRDEPYVSDFGLAKFLEGNVDQTLPGVVMGTLPYMAPEQAAGQTHRLSQRTEVWALGVILYELVIGCRPFQSKDRTELTRHVLEGIFPAPRTVRPDIDRKLEQIILRCLKVQPSERYPTASNLAESLEDWVKSVSSGEKKMTRPRSQNKRTSHRVRKVFIGVGVVLAITFSCFYSFRGFPGLQTIPPDASLPVEKQETILVGDVGRPILAPKWVVGENGSIDGVSGQDGTYFIRSPNLSLVELMSSPPWPAFVVEAEIRHDETAKGVVGLYFFHCKREGGKGIEHLFCKLTFADALRLKGGVAECQLNRYRLIGKGALDGFRFGLKQFTPVKRGMPAPWRKMRIEFRPQQFSPSWEGESFIEVSAEKIKNGVAQICKQEGLGISVHSRGGLGLYIDNSAASFRKISLKPLP